MTKKTNKNDWVRMRFKKNKVWVALDQSGKPRVEDNKLRIKYQLDQPHEYLVNQGNVRPLDIEVSDNQSEAVPPKKEFKKQSTVQTQNNLSSMNAIHLYTDGASSGNPGPSGIGILLRFRGHEKEVSKYIGLATNNIAELEAIRTGLSLIKRRNLPVRVYTDSSYALGLLAEGWKAKKNQDLVAEIRKQIAKFGDIVFIKVKGHTGDEGNERADKLATNAVARRE